MTTKKIILLVKIEYIFIVGIHFGCVPNHATPSVLLITNNPAGDLFLNNYRDTDHTHLLKINCVQEKSYLTEDSLVNYQGIVLNSGVKLNYSELIELKRYAFAGGRILYFNYSDHQHYSDDAKAIIQILLGSDTLTRTVRSSTKFANFISIHNRSTEEELYELGSGKLYVISRENILKNFTKDKLNEYLTYLIADGSLPSYRQVNITSVPPTQKFSAITILDHLHEPLGMEILDNQDILLIERAGAILYYSERKKENKLIANLEVNFSKNRGLNTVTLDPHFTKNHWVYFSYNPKKDSCNEYISRYYLAEDSLILNTRKDLLKVPVCAGEKKMAGNLLAFDQAGNLNFILGNYRWQTLDDQNPEPDSSLIVYRIHLYNNSTYTNPADYQTAESPTLSQPEILNWNANFTDTTREISSLPIVDRIVLSTNRSLNWIQGLRIIPEKNQISKSSLNCGSVYRYNPYIFSKNQFPKYYNQKLLLFDQDQQQLKAATYSQGKWETEPVMDSLKLGRLSDMQFGPDGSLYLLNYGEFDFANNNHAALIRITYAVRNRSPISKISTDLPYGAEPLSVNFNAGSSYDPDSEDSLRFIWTIEDTTIVTKQPLFFYTFLKPGIYYPKVQVIDNLGNSSTDSVKITVGNSVPEIRFSSTDNTSFYWKNTRLSYQIDINDLEDGAWNENNALHPIIVKLKSEPVDAGIFVCYKAEIGKYYVSRKDHGSLSDTIYHQGEFNFDQDIEETGAGLVMEVTYQDSGSDSIPPKLVRKEFVIRNPKVKAITCDSMGGAVKMADETVRFTKPMGYISFNDIDLTGVNHITYRFKSWVSGQLSLRIGDLSGPDLSRINIKEDNSGWQEITARVGAIEGKYNLYFAFESEDSVQNQSSEPRFLLNWIYFGREKKGRLTNSAFNLLEITE